ncbi:Uncharacterised protein [Mycobacteroides abscessus subsp. abscessus]|nr:Uncharacterised protein [Mycobacteroides abscessus subsp. abscessus]
MTVFDIVSPAHRPEQRPDAMGARMPPRARTTSQRSQRCGPVLVTTLIAAPWGRTAGRCGVARPGARFGVPAA